MDQATSQPSALDSLIEALTTRLPHAPPEAVSQLYRRLLSRGSTELLRSRDQAGLVELLEPLYRLLDDTSAAGEVGVRSWWDPDVPGRGILQTVMGDCPFIVDTLREYVHSVGLEIAQLLHPVLVVDRGDDGRVASIRERSTDGAPVSVTHIVLEGVIDEDARNGLEDAVATRLRQVQRVTADFDRMLGRAAAIEAELEGKKAEIPWRLGELEEIQELLRWMRETGFVFLGYRRYDIQSDEAGRSWIQVDPDTALGILGDSSTSRYRDATLVEALPPDLKARVLGGPLLIVSKTNAESPVRRRAQMDYIGIKRLGSDGTVRGEHRFVGLLTAKAYSQDASDIPILRRKLREILQLERAPRGSHDYNVLIQTFNSMPKEELFLSSVEEIRGVIETVRDTDGGDRIRVTARPDSLGRGYNLMVILPKNRFSAAVRRRLQAALVETYHGRLLNYHLALGQGDQARLHFYVSHDPDKPHPDEYELETVVRETVRSWDEKLEEALRHQCDAARARALADRYARRFPSDYQAAVRIENAVADVLALATLDESGDQQASIRPTEGASAGTFKLKVFARHTFVLSDVIPTLENLGFRVLDAYRFSLEAAPGLAAATIHVFMVETGAGAETTVGDSIDRLAEALRAVHQGQTEDDSLNSLILSGGLTWQQVVVLRALAGYAFRTGAVVSRTGAQRPLTKYPRSAGLLFRAFEVRFDPDFGDDRETAFRDVQRLFLHSLADVRGIEDDRTLRRLLTLVHATQRTNFYRGDLKRSPLIALKFDSRAIDFLPHPRPKHEVYLRGARTEAAHLRMDDVARGGIRWSDRYEDFRVEVLGLVKTQRVKNAVIVPAGAKGAFIARRLPATSSARAAAALESYKEFILGLLEITDNVVDGEIRHPDRVVRHDGVDSYLVVAADKGTAKFSDTANALAIEAGFWLGDAFASGGSNGYDHKREGITARGAWECVKRHFREMDLDFEHQPFSVVGIGDMSGDVFGNGMLLSRKIELVAAFDHRHIFLDPSPDPEVSWEERKRLFELPASSWADYDASRISPGGGVFDRTAKEIRLSPQTRERLGLLEETLNGEELIRALLRAEVDLLWNGGIGTYVKATAETHADVGDPSNDGVRIDATELVARVVGEGGNLGLTQRARVEYALAGGRINTDALDNSAGVDMSDHEVNLKILLSAEVHQGSLTPERRNELLADCTDEVAEAVLRNNATQSLAVSLDERRAEASPGVFREAIQRLEQEGVLMRALEQLPADDELEQREAQGLTLTRPELCVLLAHAKLHMRQWLQSSGVPQDPAMLDLVRAYFPPRALEVVDDGDLEGHRLRSHIASTMLTNRFVDRMGAASHIRLVAETDRAPAIVARTWYVASLISDADDLYGQLESVGSGLRSGALYQAYLDMSDALTRATAWLIHRTSTVEPISGSVEALRGPVREIRAALPGLLSGERLDRFRSHCALHEMDGLDPKTAEALVTFRYLDELLPIASLIRATGSDTAPVGAVYLKLAEEIDFPWLGMGLAALDADDGWSRRSARILSARLEDARLRLAAEILRSRAADDPVERAMERFRHDHAVNLRRIQGVIAEIRSAGSPNLASLLVAVEAIARDAGAVGG